jgi:hypothetical protein
LATAGGSIGADADVEATLQHGLDCRDAVAEQHIAAGIVHHGCTMIGKPPDIVIVEPDAVGGDEVGAEQPQVLEMRRLCPAVGLETDDDLRFRLLDVAVQANAEFPRQLCAGPHKSFAAMMRDGWSHSGTDLLAVEAPILECLAHGGQARLGGCQGQPRHLLLQGWRQNISGGSGYLNRISASLSGLPPGLGTALVSLS